MTMRVGILILLFVLILIIIIILCRYIRFQRRMRIHMKLRWMYLTLACVLLLSACGGQPAAPAGTGNVPAENKSAETIIYQSENGPVEVPAHPQRVVVLSNFTGHVMALDVPLVGVDKWAKSNPRFSEALQNVEEVSDETLEKVMELEPDLIIAESKNKNIEQFRQIAPTVIITYGKTDYLTRFLEIGKLLNKEKEAQAWIDDFQKRAKQAGEEIRAKIGADATVTVFESYEKALYVFGDNWGRGTEIVYQEMKLGMPEKVKEHALKEGYHALSLEVLPEFAGDYMILSKDGSADLSFQDTETYRNIPAVKNNRVFEVDARTFFYNDPVTLEYQLEFITKSFLGK